MKKLITLITILLMCNICKSQEIHAKTAEELVRESQQTNAPIIYVPYNPYNRNSLWYQYPTYNRNGYFYNNQNTINNDSINRTYYPTYR